MLKRLRQLATEATADVIWEAIKFIAGLVAAAAGSALLGGLLAQAVVAIQPLSGYVQVAAAALGVWVVLWIRRRYARNYPVFPKLDSDYLVVEKKIFYEYLTRTSMRYRREYKLRALRNGLDRYSDKYHWTGSGQLVLSSGIPEHEVRNAERKNVWQYFEVRFPRSLNRGEEVEAEVIWGLDDSAGKAQPFFSVVIEEPTDRLYMHLRLPVALNVRQAVCEVSSELGAKRPIKTETRLLDRKGEVSWDVPMPKLLHAYEIRWTF